MAEVIRTQKYVVLVYTRDYPPAHVHVEFDNCTVRVLIRERSVEEHSTVGRPKRPEVKRAVETVAENLDACLPKWKEIHG